MPKFDIKGLNKLVLEKLQPPKPVDRRGTLGKLLNVARTKKPK